MTQYRIKPIAITLIVVGFLFFIKFQFPLYKITSDAMLPSFKNGEIVLVNKWSGINKGDVVIFENNGKVFISRVIALSGDEILSENGNMSINNIQENNIDLLYEHAIFCTSNINDSIIQDFEEIYPKREYKAYLTKYASDSLRTKQGVTKVQKIIHSKNALPIYRGDSTFTGNRDNFGPIKLPPNQSNYWLMSDNRHKAKDSRYIGFINEHDIIGKVVYTFNNF